MKPGYLTTEFYLSLAAMLAGAAKMSGLLDVTATTIDNQVVGLIIMFLSALGYTGARMVLKGGDRKAKATEAASKSYAKAAALVKDAGPTDG